MVRKYLREKITGWLNVNKKNQTFEQTKDPADIKFSTYSLL